MTVTLERNLLAAPQEAHAKVEIYSGVARLARTVWGSEVRVAGTSPTTAVVWCHPTANFLGHYSLAPLAERGVGAIGLTTRYVGNDTALLLENCLLDIGAMVAHLRERGYEKVVLVGNSGGASIVPYYQAQALAPSVTAPPGGGPDLTEVDLSPVDAIVMLNAHPARARSLHRVARSRDHRRTPTLRARPRARHVPPRQRAAVLGRVRRALPRRAAQRESARSRPGPRDNCALLGAAGHEPAGLDDLAFVVQGTTADLRFLDGAIDPSDRVVGTSLWGPPAIANYLPAGIGRCTTLRSWLNQWSLDHTLGDSLRWLPTLTTPVMVILGSADPVVTPSMAQQMYDAAAEAPRELLMVPGATHYFEGQAELLAGALDAMTAWIAST